jgi:uncharacterized membrane protein
MAIGPVQLIVLGFSHPEFHGEIIAELERLRASDTVKVIDALAVHRDAEGEIEVAHLSNLTKEEAVELGSKVAALIGLGVEGEEGFEKGAEIGDLVPVCWSWLMRIRSEERGSWDAEVVCAGVPPSGG